MSDKPTLASALAAVQAELAPGIGANTDGQVGQARYRYADLAAHLEALRPVCATHGLALVQGTEHLEGGGLVLSSTLYHGPTGDSLKTVCPVLVESGRGSSMQSLGSAITYARRYAIAALFGLATEDDDGASAGTRPAPKPNGNGHAKPKPKPTTRDDDGRREPRLTFKPQTASEPPQPPPIDDDDIPF